eukprot:CAMPEP_0113935686 /NCGR_PEP_ID=MMETSP1339-20121228/2790_1 /TAXON_ID=94617 /ORGANISM="Fibrocapsa japonica" /LENGTH=296 /DNA_ID=CAMNT_0000937921 /DNA_START=96 /DNA_END=986 /DNA_ORIENTATION=- /assembly_acc=CAM_ASM_000762
MLSRAVIVALLAACLGSSNAFIANNALKFQPSVSHMCRNTQLSMAREAVLAGNWKMNPETLDEAVALAKGVVEQVKDGASGEVIVIPPSPFLVPVADIIKGSGVQLGGQNAFFEDKGAYTGAVSTCMLKSVGAKYVLAGHSERRTLFRDDDSSINRKVRKILEAGLKPILCIGETKEEYDQGLVELVCGLQISKDLADVTAEQMKDIVIAYEPVWAIGTGLTATPEIAQSVHKYIRSCIAKKFGDEVAEGVRIQYGGSVTPETVDELMACPDIDGALVGGASLVADKFGRICKYQS